jgi:alpha-beta hydrolase superfamily lysophospholipase
VIFIHGLWLHSTSWLPWVEHFRAAGYDAMAPGWPGEPRTVHEAREHPEAIAGLGVAAITEHYSAIIDTLRSKPVLIGHSLGGLIAQKLLGQGRAAAAVAIDAAQIRGVFRLPVTTFRAAFPVLRNPTQRTRAISLTREQFHYAFGNAIPMEESNDLHEHLAVPAPARPLFEAATANLRQRSPAWVNTRNTVRGPLLLVGGGRDHTVPASVTRATRRRYRNAPTVTELIEFADRGHSLVVDHGWREIADRSLAWLREALPRQARVTEADAPPGRARPSTATPGGAATDDEADAAS